jgi:D-3-phosphoglycerate dehydrogenase
VPQRVVVTAASYFTHGPGAGDPLAAMGVEVVRRPAGQDLATALRGAVGVIAGSEPFTEAVIATCPELRVIARWGVGYDAVDLAAATRHGVVVTTTPGTLEEAVADFAFGLMLALARRIPEAAGLMRRGGWSRPLGWDVHGRCLGIVGIGRIGSAMAKRAHAFAMRVVAFDPGVDAATIAARGAEPLPLPELLRQADFVTLHANLNPTSRHLIGAAELALMRPGACLINTARGGLVDTQALIDALESGHLGGAALDVYEAEPLPAEHPLRQAPRCILTPHMASASREAARAMSLAAAQAVADVLSGRRPASVVNPEVYANG